MGMEYGHQRSSSPLALSFNRWVLHHVTPSPLHQHHHHDAGQSSSSGEEGDGHRMMGNSPSTSCLHAHSAPVSSQLYSSCRRASSFPIAQQAGLPSALKVRSQSESAALNNLSIKVPRNLLLHDLEMCRQQMQNCGGRYGKVSFFSPVQEPIQSDSEGDDSLVSSEEGSTSSSNVHEDHLRELHDDLRVAVVAVGVNDDVDDDEDDDLGVVRDLDLDMEDDHEPLPLHDDNTNDHYEQRPIPESAIVEPPFPIDISEQPDAPSLTLVEHAEQLASAAITDALAAESVAPPAAINGTDFLTPFGELKPTESQQRLAELVAEQCRLRFEQQREEEQLQKNKKSVRFADDCGHCLETVRVMTEPSDYPPKISSAVIKRYRKAAAAAAAALSPGGSTLPTSLTDNNNDNEDDDDEDEDSSSTNVPRTSWKMGFNQPASEYVKFRETLDNQKVALENVMLKNDIGRMMGTIKVANISFEKRVFIRYTADGWQSYLDRPTQYQSSPQKALDTFRFDIELPKNTDKVTRIEFCVCFVANGSDEYWDSNGEKNYQLTSLQSEPPLLQQPSTKADGNPPHRRYSYSSDDAYLFEYGDWTKFASWKQLSTQGPYW